MPKYLCLQRTLGPDQGQGAKPSPAQMQAMYEKLNAWRDTFEESLVDLGGRLGEGKAALPEPPPDGPLVEVKELAKLVEDDPARTVGPVDDGVFGIVGHA